MKVLNFISAIMLALIISLVAIPAAADSVPLLPESFYGNVTLFCSPAPVGTVVEARGPGVVTGTGNPITTTETGKYGSNSPTGIKLSVQGNIPSGATITFWINGVQADQTIVYSDGQTTQLDLSVSHAALTVTSTAGGSVTRNPDNAFYNCGDSVVLTAIPDANYHFMNWSGDASGSTNPLTVTINGNTSITANFALNTYTLTVNKVGNGSVTKAPDQANYNYNASVGLTAAADAGWTFSGWSGDLTGSTNPANITMNGNKTITATFTQNEYTLTLSALNGTVSKNPDKATYHYGDSVILTPNPDANYHFMNWSGDASGSTNPLTITINGNTSITANFALNTYTLTVNKVGNGSVTKAPDQANYNYNASVGLTAAADTGWTFSGWSGDLTGSTNPANITMNGNKTITATFTQNEYTLTLSALNGTVSKNPDKATYHYGDSVILTPNPDANYHFMNWSGDASGSTNPLTITINGNTSITANFALNTYTLTVNKVGNGSVTKAPDQANYNYNASVGLTAAADTGWTFSGWSGDLTGSTNPANITMNGNKTITATFTQNEYTLTLSALNGTVSKNPDKATYHYGDSVILTPNPAANYHFVNWSGDASGSTNPLTVTINANTSITANFERYLTVSLCVGWNLFSTPVTLASNCDTYSEFITLNQLSVDQVCPSYSFDAQAGYWNIVTADFLLKPCDAIYIKMVAPGTALILPSTSPSVATKQLYPGWNLTSLASYHEMPVNEGFASIYDVTGGLPGYSQVVSPLLCGQADWAYTRFSSPTTIPVLIPGKGYWVFMTNGGTLAGFTFTPQ